MPLISVIVPVYRVDAYLERCVDSLLNQSMREIEIILIDDGSPDKCGTICDRYAAQDTRVRVIHQENAGLSAARNAGLDRAQGEWIMFVDSDDWVELDFCRLPYEAALAHQADLVMFGTISHKKTGEIVFSHVEEGLLSKDDAITYAVKKSIAVWKKLYHSSLFREIRFPEGYVFEDIFVTPKLVHAARSVYRLDACLYHYAYRADSICHAREPRSRRDYLVMKSAQIRDLSCWGYADLARESMQNLSLIYLIRLGRFAEDSALHMETLRRIRRFPSGWTWKKKMIFVLFRVSPRLFDSVCILSGRRLPPVDTIRSPSVERQETVQQ